jgi:predicted amidohydrolase YtcJ
MTIREGRIVAVDAEADADRVIRAQGMTITPGLVDAHIHLLLGGRSLGELDISKVTSRGQFEAAVARRDAELPPDRWLIARGWSSENWPGHETPDKSWLAAAGRRPVVCYRMDMHAVLVNDPVLKRCDTSRTLPGGRIERDPATGEPTGLMVEAAAWKLVNPLVPDPDEAQRRDSLFAAQECLHAHGVTAVGTMEYARDVRDVFVPLWRGPQGLSVRCRVTLLDRGWPMDFGFARAFTGDDRLDVIGFKAFVDGTLGSRTARMLADYADDPGQRGLFVELAAEGHLEQWAHAVASAGFSPALHAIGDEAVRVALGALEGVDRGVRPRIEHAQHVHPDDVTRFHGLVASMQPLHKADDGRYMRRRLGPERVGRAFAFRQLLAAGARLAFGSDWPVVSCDPILGIRTAVTGLTLDGEVCGSDENLTVEEALCAYTSGAAHALGLDEAGTIRAGALGDCVIFDRDPLEADWSGELPKVLMTIVGGRVVYDGR